MARPIKAAMITTSTAITTMATIRTDETGTQTALNSGLDNPTKTPPSTNRPARMPWKMYWAAEVPEPSLRTHSKCCSIENRASWSKIVVKITPI